jgi:tetratricopeptide (TPR) repeat protein
MTGEAGLSELFVLFERLAEGLAGQTGYAVRGRPVPSSPMPLGVFEDYVKGLVAATPDAQRRFLENAMIQAPHDGRVLTALWQVYTVLGAHDRALETASATPPESPLYRRARFAVALSLIELGRLDGALIELEALNAASRRPVVSNAIGVVRLRRGDLAPSATEAFAEAVELAPGHTTYLFNLGYGFALAGEATQALLWLREAVRHDATDGAAHLVMSAVLAAGRRPAEARREFELARLLGTPFDPATVALAADVPDGLARLPTSLDLDTPYIRTRIANPDARDQLETAAFHLAHARQLIDERRDRDAADELRRAIYLAPYEDEPHLLLGEVYQRGGRLLDAIDEFTVALWCRETARAQIALGTALLETGDRDAARRAAERALELDPASAEAMALLERIGGRLGAASLVLTSEHQHAR